MTPEIRASDADDADDAVQLLDAAMLEFDRERVRRRVADGNALVAVDEDTLVGVCVLDAARANRKQIEIESVAVHRSRRGQGIGRALVTAAASRAAGPLVARFHEQVRPFYEALGFEIREHTEGRDPDGDTSDDRFFGVLR